MTPKRWFPLFFSVMTFVFPALAADDALICRNLLLAAQPSPYANRELVAVGQARLLDQEVRAIAFGPNSRWIYALLCNSQGCIVRRWATVSLAFDPKFAVKVASAATALAASVDGSEIAISMTSLIYRYSTENGRLTSTAVVPYTFPTITQLIYTENANHLLIAGENGTINVNGLGRERTTSWGYRFADDYMIIADKFLPPLKYAEPGKERMFGQETGTPDRIDELNRMERATKRTLRPGYSSPVRVAGSPDGRQFTLAYLDGTAGVFNSLTGNQIAQLKPEKAIAEAPGLGTEDRNVYFDSAVEYSLDGIYLVTSHGVRVGGEETKRQVSVWDAEFGTLVRTTTLLPGSHFVQLEHPAIVDTLSNGRLQILDFASERKLFTLEGGGGKLKQVLGTPGGKWFYTLTDSEISVWDLKAREHRTVFADPKLKPIEMRLAPNGKYVVVKAQGQTAPTDVRVYLLKVE